MSRILSELRRSFFKESKTIDIELTSVARQKLREVMSQPNPRLSEIPFMGLGEGNIVSDILFVDGGRYSQYSGLLKSGFLGSSVHKQSDIALWDKIIKTGNLDKVIFHGHSHPSGKAEVGGVKYVVNPSTLLLEPSNGGTKYMQSAGDLAYYNALLQLNPNINLPFIAISANTPHGVKLKVFQLSKLLAATNFKGLDKVPSKIIDL